MKHFFNYKTQSFYIDGINIKIPKNSIEITEQQHNELYNAINKGCIVFDNLTCSEPQPSSFHSWDSKNKTWIENTKAKTIATIQQNKLTQNSLINDANNKIILLQRAVKYNRATDDEKKLLEQLELYTVEIGQVDTSDINAVFPDMPE